MWRQFWLLIIFVFYKTRQWFGEHIARVLKSYPSPLARNCIHLRSHDSGPYFFDIAPEGCTIFVPLGWKQFRRHRIFYGFLIAWCHPFYLGCPIPSIHRQREFWPFITLSQPQHGFLVPLTWADGPNMSSLPGPIFTGGGHHKCKHAGQ